MWSQRYDLHSHSLHSDGEHPVERVAELMHGEGVQFWALTDHDTTAGWQEAHAAASERGLTFVPGVEITCEPALPPTRSTSPPLVVNRIGVLAPLGVLSRPCPWRKR